MKKLIFGLAAVGAVFAVRPVLKRSIAQKIHQHCNQMAAHCTEMMRGDNEAPGRETMHQTIREHREEMAAPHDERTEPSVAA